MRNIYQFIDTLKDSDSAVLLIGEKGIGKEVIARAVHYNSTRKDGPFVAVNCSTILKRLMARKLFGHSKESYTGTRQVHKGYFEEADGGTIFLDEIGELDKDLQVKLLWLLNRGEILRVEDSVTTKVDVRLITASNKDLYAEVIKGNFREDLYYRIYEMPIQLTSIGETKRKHYLNSKYTTKSRIFF